MAMFLFTLNILFVVLSSSFTEGFLDPNEIVPILTTPLGRLRGTVNTSRSGKYYYNFLGIPYGVASRFQPSTPPPPWEGILDAQQDGPICPQMDPVTGTILGTEDCLSLNVHVPHEERCGDNPLPVLVNIHGGGLAGSVSMYGGVRYLLNECVVFVGMNYRFGAFGFLTTLDGLIPGNNGLKDQILALHWIQSNIASFRGDPNLVTIMGISFGGLSTSHILSSPLGEGLFHRAIVQSGNVMNPFGINEDTEAMARRVGEGLSCSMESTSELKLCLEAATVENILMVQCPLEWCLSHDSSTPSIERNWTDASPPLHTENPANRLRRGDFPKVPIIAGFTENEGMGYVLSLMFGYPDVIKQLNEDWEGTAPGFLNYENLGIPENELREMSRKIREFYFGDQPIGMETLMSFSNLYSDRFFIQGSFEFVELVSKFTNVYSYVLTYKGGNSGLAGLGYELPLSTHATDNQFLFNLNGTMDLQVGTEPREFSERLIRLWTNFALTGVADDTSGDATWNVTTGRANSYWHRLDMPSGNYENYLDERRQFWENLGLYEYELN